MHLLATAEHAVDHVTEETPGLVTTTASSANTCQMPPLFPCRPVSRKTDKIEGSLNSFRNALHTVLPSVSASYRAFAERADKQLSTALVLDQG